MLRTALLLSTTCMLCVCLDPWDGSFTIDAPDSIDFDDLYDEISIDIQDDEEGDSEEFFFPEEPIVTTYEEDL